MIIFDAWMTGLDVGDVTVMMMMMMMMV